MVYQITAHTEHTHARPSVSYSRKFCFSAVHEWTIFICAHRHEPLTEIYSFGNGLFACEYCYCVKCKVNKKKEEKRTFFLAHCDCHPTYMPLPISFRRSRLVVVCRIHCFTSSLQPHFLHQLLLFAFIFFSLGFSHTILQIFLFCSAVVVATKPPLCWWYCNEYMHGVCVCVRTCHTQNVHACIQFALT